MKNSKEPFKFDGFHSSYTSWWDSLSIEEKLSAKKHFLSVREWNMKQRMPYPDMPDITHIKVNKLSDRQIYRVWVFKDKKI